MTLPALEIQEMKSTPAYGGGFTAAGSDVEGFSGAISLPLLPDLIQIYTVSLSNGALTIRYGENHGTIWFEHGNMVHAVCASETGEAAVYRMLQWPSGHFSLAPDAVAPTRSITSSWQNVLMEGCRRLDEGIVSVVSDAPAGVVATLAGLEGALEEFHAAALFDADGALIAQRSSNSVLNFTEAGPLLIAMVQRWPPSLLDCFWLSGQQLHFLQLLPEGRLLHLVAGSSVNIAVIRRVIARLF